MYCRFFLSFFLSIIRCTYIVHFTYAAQLRRPTHYFTNTHTRTLIQVRFFFRCQSHDGHNMEKCRYRIRQTAFIDENKRNCAKKKRQKHINDIIIKLHNGLWSFANRIYVPTNRQTVRLLVPGHYEQ